MVHPSGRYYVSVNGYSGQDSHVADSTKALRIMLGVDDNAADHLRLVPRFPAAWTVMALRRYPVLTGTARQRLCYRYERAADGQTFEYEFERPVDRFSVRLGPIPAGAQITGAAHDQRALPWECVESGDSRWVWLKDLSGTAGCVTLAWD